MIKCLKYASPCAKAREGVSHFEILQYNKEDAQRTGLQDAVMSL